MSITCYCYSVGAPLPSVHLVSTVVQLILGPNQPPSYIRENLLECNANFPRVECAVFFFPLTHLLDNEDDLSFSLDVSPLRNFLAYLEASYIHVYLYKRRRILHLFLKCKKDLLPTYLWV
jgi:hypothetical protein